MFERRRRVDRIQPPAQLEDLHLAGGRRDSLLHDQQVAILVVELELDRVHQPAHQIDPQAADLALVERGVYVRRRHIVGIEAAAAIVQRDDEFVPLDAPGQLNLAGRLGIVAVLDDVEFSAEPVAVRRDHLDGAVEGVEGRGAGEGFGFEQG